MSPIRTTLAAGAAVLALAAAAFAADGPQTGARPWHRHGGFACAIQQGRTAAILARVHDRLHITDTQGAAWTSFTQDVTQAVQPIGAECGQRPAAAASLPDRLAVMAQRQQTHAEATAKVAQATSRLYAELSPEQKQQADQLMRGRMGRGARQGQPAGTDGTNPGTGTGTGTGTGAQPGQAAPAR